MVECAKCGRAENAAFMRLRMHKDGSSDRVHRICPRRKRKRGTKKAVRLLRHVADHQRAAAMGYKDPESRVLPDGREILKGDDWMDRIVALGNRANHCCEIYKLDEWTDVHWTHWLGNFGDPHHVISRSKRRDDRLNNLLYVCREGHRLLDRRRVGGSKRSAAA